MGPGLDRSPALDPALAAALRAALPELADEIIAAIGQAIPEYRRPMEGAFGRGVRSGVQRALEQFIVLVEQHGSSQDSDREIYRQLGRGEHRSGRRLDALQAAYRLGARLSWRRISEVARDWGADAQTVSLLAESVFAHIEEISASSVEGYAQAQALQAGERARRRARLVRLLVTPGEALDGALLRASALEADWRLPARLAALACQTPEASRLGALVGPGAIAARIEDLTCVLIADPDAPGRHEALRATLAERDLSAALGPMVPSAEAAHSFRRARTGLELGRRGVPGSGELLICSEHLLELLLLEDAELTRELAERNLTVLEGQSPGSRERLTRTLEAWLRNQGDVPAIAAELHVHRQTVRYRLARLRELFGAQLDDPERRLELELALRGMSLAARIQPTS
jgi:hypothetical protein